MSDGTPTKSQEVRLVSYPDGELSLDHFEVAVTELAEPEPGQVVVRNDWMSLGTVYRDQMQSSLDIPIPVFQLGQPMWGRTVGTVVKSASPDLAVGDLVEHFSGWRDHVVGYAGQFFKRDPELLPGSEYFLSNGPTAWRGLAEIAKVREGDVVFVSGATSGVGCLAAHIAKALGAAKVIGSTGSPQKIDFLVREAGYDAAFDYHDGPVVDRLRELAPDGITVFFDNVGGEQFEAAVQAAAPAPASRSAARWPHSTARTPAPGWTSRASSRASCPSRASPPCTPRSRSRTGTRSSARGSPRAGSPSRTPWWRAASPRCRRP